MKELLIFGALFIFFCYAAERFEVWQSDSMGKG